MGKISHQIGKIQTILDSNHLAEVGAKFMKSITPVDTGNARSKTRAENNIIHADYQYAKRLDEGWSDQNKTGLIEPTIQYLQDYIQKEVK